LADHLEHLRGQDVLVLALPRGGVPVAAEIARRLDAELDVLVVRKISAPGQPELALGAVASGGVCVLNPDIVDALRLSEREIERLASPQRREIVQREQAYRGSRAPFDARRRTVILVDDGIATGATMLAAIEAARKLNPARVVVAVGVAPATTKRQLELAADEVVCLATPEPFHAVGLFYEDFTQVTNDDVRDLLALSRIGEHLWLRAAK
jgi:predicted phosphoribosyltransferase